MKHFSNKNNYFFSFLFVTLIIFSIFSIFIASEEAASIAITFFFLFNFLHFAEDSFDIRYLIILISAIQWIFGAVLSYHFVPEDNVYAMKIPPQLYFKIAIPGIIAYYAGLFFPFKYPKINKKALIYNVKLIIKKIKT